MRERQIGVTLLLRLSTVCSAQGGESNTEQVATKVAAEDDPATPL
jgi:hypothetical protein